MKKKNLKAMGAACAAAILACSCGSSKNALQTSALEGEWNIITVNGQKAEAEKDPYIGMNLQEKRLYGCAGCNRIMGSLQVDEDKAGQLSFGQVGATRMLCNDMTTEHAVLAALDKVAGYEGSEKELTLTDGDGNALLTLAKRPAATLASLQGKWDITAVYGQAVADIEATDQAPFLEFNAEEKKLHGNAGCNIVNGGFTHEEGQPTSLKFGQLISTMMAGPGMQVERQVLDALNKVNGFVVKDEHNAALLDANGEEALTLKKQ